MAITQTVLRAGAAKAEPFTICIVANPVLETPEGSGTFVADPIIGRYAKFKAVASYIEAALFCMLPGQREDLLCDPAIEPFVRLVSIYDDGLALEAENCLVAQDNNSDTLVAQRNRIPPWLARYGFAADVVYAVSSSCTHTEASAWFTSDDDTGPGIAFDLDGATFYHRLQSRIPGTVAIHATASSLTALHEFGHAISSYSNGKIVDLYEDGGIGLNKKVRRPMPGIFGTYNGRIYGTDTLRDGLGYPAAWRSYHPELVNAACPAVMDNYWESNQGANACRHDALTADFIRDRVLAKMTR